VTWRLVLRTPPLLRVDARRLQPAPLAALPADAVLRLRLPHGRDEVELGEWFALEAAGGSTQESLDGPSLELVGDLSRFDAVGAGLAAGRIEVTGDVGDAAGMGMSGGHLSIRGSARDLAGCAMRGGWLGVDGDVRDLAASALPGDIDGMSGGTLVVRGRAGARLADRMRRGIVVVHGDAGDFLASRMVAGTLALGGTCGAHAGWGMRRGSLAFAGAAPSCAPTFVPVESDADVFWQLLARDLARFGPPFDALARRRVRRWAGDLAVLGKGELLIPDPQGMPSG
jgi:formylmethanofuran dehydrogenase subunit C